MMQCPKCRGEMAVVEHAGIAVDRCTACGGLWFDGVEHLTLRKVAGSAAIDTAPHAPASTAASAISCPVCHEAMTTHYDAYQHHIHYEACLKGHGAFFDAGEFRDFVTDDWSDFFKGLFTSYPRN